MKKFVFFTIVVASILAVTPSSAQAKQYCEVVSGDGKSFGSEIACGDEHFYIFDRADGTARVLAKYNLNTRYAIHRVDIDHDENETTRKNTCTAIASENGAKVRFDQFYGSNDPDHCFYEKELTGDIIQNPNALSAHWDSLNNYLYPQIGDVYPITRVYTYSSDVGHIGKTDFKVIANGEGKIYDGTELEDLIPYVYPFTPIDSWGGGDPDAGNPYINRYNELGGALYTYKSILEDGEYEVSDMSLLSLDDLHNVAKRHNLTFDYADWLANSTDDEPVLASLKDYLTNDEAWLYSSTYWLRTGMIGNTGNPSLIDGDSLLFINQRGEICNAGSQTTLIPACSKFTHITIGAGVRPLVSMPDTFKYRISTVTDGNGSIEVDSAALSGDTIIFRTKSTPRYALSSVTVTTDTGQSIVFNAGDVHQTDDGSYMISDSSFEMPERNITITANWERLPTTNRICKESFQQDGDFLSGAVIRFSTATGNTNTLENVTFEAGSTDYETEFHNRTSTSIDWTTGQSCVTITNLEDGNYRISELEPPDGYDSVGSFEISVSDGVITGHTGVSPIITLRDDDTTVLIKDMRMALLTITEDTRGQGGDLAKEFDIEVEIAPSDMCPDAPSLTHIEYSVVSDIISSGTFELSNNKFSTTVAHGNELVLRAPLCYSYTVTESDYSSDGYVTTYDASNTGVITEDAFVTIINTKDGAPATGIDSKASPIPFVLTGMAIPAIVLYIRRRCRVDRI